MTIENAQQLFTLSAEKSERAGFDNNVAILFDYIQDETSSVEADITDNWVESNYSLQDHIAIKPRIYRLRGCVGEVIYENVSRIISQLQGLDSDKHPLLNKTMKLMENPTPLMENTANAVNGLSAFAPIVSNYTKLAMNVAKQIDSSYDRYYQMWQNFRQQNQLQNKRQKAVYTVLMRMLQNRIPVKLTSLMFDVENESFYKEAFKEGLYENMYYLQSVSAHQADNAYISDIEVTIKEFRIAVTKNTKVDTKNNAASASVNKTVMSHNGQVKGNPVSPERAKQIVNSVGEKYKDVAKEALKGKPMAFNAVKTLYNQFKDAATNSFIPVSEFKNYNPLGK